MSGSRSSFRKWNWLLLTASAMAGITCITAWVIGYQIYFSLVLSLGVVELDASVYRGQFSFGYLRWLDSTGGARGIWFERSDRGPARALDARVNEAGFYDFGWMSRRNRLHVHDMPADDPFFKEHNFAPPPPLPPIYYSITRELMVPAWFLTSLAVIAFGLLLRQTCHILRYRGRLAAGHCTVCDYNLCAHAPGNKCPECDEPKSLTYLRASKL